VEKRVNEYGVTVRFKPHPTIKDLERIQRALGIGLGAFSGLKSERHFEYCRSQLAAAVRNLSSMCCHASVVLCLPTIERAPQKAATYCPAGSSHRLFLIDRKVLDPPGSEGGAKVQFVVLGATRNVYTVTVGQAPSCTCPDAAKGNLCKHILFVMLRVLKLRQNNPLVWQKALLKSEVRGFRFKRTGFVCLLC
jgi:SWIM zinc finger